MTEYPIEIEVNDGYTVNEPRLKQAIGWVLQQHECEAGTGVSVQVVDNATVQMLNHTYRGVDAPTDVLSFPSDVPPLPEEADDAEALYLGDLALAYPYASAQAAKLGHVLDDSLTLLVVHGTLHLLGYDHDTPENRAEMWEAQAEALTALGVPLAIVPTLEDSDHHGE